jgi:hypothetical protein
MNQEQNLGKSDNITTENQWADFAEGRENGESLDSPFLNRVREKYLALRGLIAKNV